MGEAGPNAGPVPAAGARANPGGGDGGLGSQRWGPGWQDEGLVFTRENGAPLDSDVISRSIANRAADDRSFSDPTTYFCRKCDFVVWDFFRGHLLLNPLGHPFP